MGTLFYNGQFLDDNQPIYSADSRAVKYGDGIFESIVVFNGVPPLLVYHYERVRDSAELLLIKMPSYFDYDWFKATIYELLKRNGYANARLRVQVSRAGEGLYLPTTHGADIHITCTPITNSEFEWSSIKVDFSPYRVDMGLLSNLKTTSKVHYIMSALHAEKVGADDCFLFNAKGTLADTVSSNVFVIKGDLIMTPALTNGGVDGVMRRHLIQLLKEKYRVIQADVLMSDIDEADEIFLTNAVRGIQSVAVVRSVVYTDTATRQILKLLNNTIKQMQ